MRKNGQEDRSRFRGVFPLLAGLIVVLSGCSLATNAAAHDDRTANPIIAVPHASTVSASLTASAQAGPSLTSLWQQKYGPVRWVWMTTPVPSPINYVPLFDDLELDRERIGNLLSWIDLAERQDGEGLVSPLRGRSMAIHVAFAEGNTLAVRPAWTCETEAGEQGGHSTSCKSVQDFVWIGMPDDTEIFAKSSELYELVTRTYKDWMPGVEPLKVPEKIQVGEPFTVTGGGWLAQQVRVEITKNGQLIWSQESMLDHGAFSVTGTLQAPVSSGDYDISVQFVPFEKLHMGSSRIGTSVKITNSP